ncbi:MAG: hypothetical protein FWF41_09945 [Betaproteobacteria bacterium]|nr:hypothetical protein [Betaproteobacteria bacterium]
MDIIFLFLFLGLCFCAAIGFFAQIMFMAMLSNQNPDIYERLKRHISFLTRWSFALLLIPSKDRQKINSGILKWGKINLVSCFLGLFLVIVIFLALIYSNQA